MLYIIYMFYSSRPIHHHRHRGKKTTPLLCRLASLEPFVAVAKPWAVVFFSRRSGVPKKLADPKLKPILLLKILGRPQKSSKIQWSRPSRPCFSKKAHDQTHCWGVLRRAVARKNCGGYAGARSSAFRVSLQEDLILCIYILYIYKHVFHVFTARSLLLRSFFQATMAHCEDIQHVMR